MNKRLMMAFCGTVLCSNGQAAVFRPTDTTVNFLGLFGTETLMALFDDQDRFFSGSHLAIRASGDQAIFLPDGAGYHVVNASGLTPTGLTLNDSDRFAVAAWSPQRQLWMAPDVVSCFEVAGSCALSWSGSLVELAADLAEDRPLQAPISSSLFLFASAMVGLVAVGRRRTPLRR